MKGFSVPQLRPPSTGVIPYIEVRREPHEHEYLDITYPNGDSYNVSLEEMHLLLFQLKVPRLKAEKFLDQVWNFYALRIDLKTITWEILPAPRYPDTPGVRPLDAYSWIIESGKEI